MNLRKVSGLPIGLVKDKIVFGSGMGKVKPAVRRLSSARYYYASSKAKGPKEIYYMYRNVCLVKDNAIFKQNNLRYDITVLQAGKVGKEHVKTIGHHHPEYKQGTTYPELYEVLKGNALFLLQQENDFIVIKAGKGDKVFVQPNCGHVTINIGRKPLVLANLVERNFNALYDKFKAKHGAMYYEFNGKFVKNPNYGDVPKPRYGKPTAKFGKKPLYTLFVNDPVKFEFLKWPLSGPFYKE